MEIKHGRLAMAACAHVLITAAGIRFPGYLSYLSEPSISFADMPDTPLAQWAAMPTLGWFQIVALVALLDVGVLKQDPEKEAGDVGGDFWVRYDDVPGIKGKNFKLNVERNNGRAAMMGIIGMMWQESICGNPIFPIGDADFWDKASQV